MAAGFSAGSPTYGPQGAGPAFGAGGGLGGAGGVLGTASALTSLAGGIASIFVGYRQARELEKQAEAEARRIRRAGDRILGAQTVAYAHAGVTQAGTPANVRDDSIAEIEREVYYSTMKFENAANNRRSEGVQGLAAGISDAGTTGALTLMGKGGSAALFGRNVRPGLGAGTFGGMIPTVGK